MRTSIFCAAILISSSVAAQSKKEMQDEIARLKAELAELKKPTEVNLENPQQKVSYGLGVLIAGNIKAQGADSVDVEVMAAGINDVLLGKTLKMDQNACMGVVQPYMQQAMVRKSEKVRSSGKKFLEENKTKEGVTTTASGLQYKVVNAGTGKQPAAVTDRVTVHYTGSLIDGTVFDSSVRSGRPANFALNEVISGWTEALLLMKEGDKWLLYIPSEIAYGERGNGPQIPPHSTLLFELELIKVN